MLIQQQHRVTVHYGGVVVGVYTADLLMQDLVLVELKAVKALDSIHVAQYLKATHLSLYLLFNFGPPRLEVKRLVNG